ncbi:hypothetical protein CYY_005686 [Polysphondylium violaceum]|uniref:Iron-binding zinc finger CDGSH type domain-containing protein n=1 Tax=Polysphondylium violaceum TaxID=133409 RepID=A0A8J4PRJ4_9MYCE|nr:hypothetical protein CYY_005686 [Polysphondylium violaceum]
MFESLKDLITSTFSSQPIPEKPTKEWDVSEQNFSLKGPVPVDPKEADKWICRCGQSKNYPYCDGAHKAHNEKTGSTIAPLKVEKGSETVYVCRCGFSKSQPFCDGAHNIVRRIEEEKVAQQNGVLVATRYAIPIISFAMTAYFIISNKASN